MKVLKTNDFVSERVKVKPVTNSEWDSAKKELEKIKPNPFGLTKKDLVGALSSVPMGVVVRMMEEQAAQGNKINIKVFHKSKSMVAGFGGFDWDRTEAGYEFWNIVLCWYEYEKFYEKYPEYKKYDLDENIKNR